MVHEAGEAGPYDGGEQWSEGEGSGTRAETELVSRARYCLACVRTQ